MADNAHRYVRNTVRKFVRTEKDMDLSTVSDLIKHGSSKGPYPEALAAQIWESLLLLFAFLRPSHAFQHAVQINLFSRQNERGHLIARLADATKVLRPLLNYPEFAPGNIQIVPTDQYAVWQDTLFDFQRESQHPIYFDTEGLYSERIFGCKVAALTLYDVDFSKVLIIRINRFNVQDYSLVKNEIRDLSRTRRFAVFGPEPFLEDLVPPQRVYNCQRNMLSLKNMCADIGLHIHKGQTMSNWGRTHLRRDQLQYAAMDVVALKYLHEKQIERNDEARGRFGYIDYEDWY
ncbi:hypothetical protein CAEBREN_03023 [Caenorhabditis brenneri]|uniref:3'-5' exonuclease domain-containing protein n=1 Tax=Caenorhabditis brenneri TaxID=135651 RepID=G0MSN4_CAEBE|nr:hypothetical protein CAEBREN_03023 [Caenorhabditis brenneri]